MKIVLFGGSGLLGKELLKINSSLVSPSHEELDITIQKDVFDYIHTVNPDMVIHSAAIINEKVINKEPKKVINTNIIGTANIATVCEMLNKRLVYISTDYVYKGDKGGYKETDKVFPFNLYAWSKLGGECSVVFVPNHLIIRTSFGHIKFPYSEAFEDKWSNKDYVDVIAPMIYEASISYLTGVINIGTEPKTLYSYAKQRNTDVKPIKLKDSRFYSPKDTTLNIKKWLKFKNGNK